MNNTLTALLDFYTQKLNELRPDVIVFTGPFLWEKAPSYTLAAIDTHLKKSNINSLPIDLNLILFHYFDDLRKNWTNLEHSNNKSLSDSFFSSTVFTPLWDKISELSPKIIGLSVSSSNESFMYRFQEFLSKKITARFILGGPSIFFHNKENFKNVPEETQTTVSSFIPGEIEYYDLKSFPEICKIESSEITLPDFKNFPLTHYPRKRHLPVMLSRGCTSRCSFCSECLLFKTYKGFDINEIFSKFDYYINTLNINWFTFYDSLINGNLQLLDNLTNEIINQELNIKWEAQCLIRSDMSVESMQKMKESGCFNLFIGMESANDKTLKRMNKKFRKKDIIPFFEKLKSVNLHFEVSLIVGFPDESEEDFLETLTFLEENHDLIPKVAQINPFIFYPHTKILNDYPELKPYKTFYRTDIMLSRVEKVLEVLKRNKIPYTESYINNLISIK